MSIGIIGAGLSGILIAEALSELGASIDWIIDAQSPEAGSGAPTALCHPFPGRSLLPHPLLKQAYAETVRRLLLWQKQIPNCVRSTKMVRPLLGRSGERIQNSYQSTWQARAEQSAWVSFQCLNYDQLKQAHPAAAHPEGAIAYEPAFSVDLSNLLLQKQRSLPLAQDRLNHLQQEGGSWIAHANKQSYRAQKCIIALGAAAHSWFPALKLGAYGGELINISSSTQLPAMYSINGLHIGQHHSGEYVFGASRWPLHKKTDLNLAAHTLFAKLPELLSLKDPAYHSVWRGIRSVYHKDRLPIAGEIPQYPNLFTLGALGAKGLLWGPYTAKSLASLMVHKHPIPQQLSSKRIPIEKWHSPLVL